MDKNRNCQPSDGINRHLSAIKQTHATILEGIEAAQDNIAKAVQGKSCKPVTAMPYSQYWVITVDPIICDFYCAIS